MISLCLYICKILVNEFSFIKISQIIYSLAGVEPLFPFVGKGTIWSNVIYCSTMKKFAPSKVLFSLFKESLSSSLRLFFQKHHTAQFCIGNINKAISKILYIQNYIFNVLQINVIKFWKIGYFCIEMIQPISFVSEVARIYIIIIKAVSTRRHTANQLDFLSSE